MDKPAYPNPETREDFVMMGQLFYEQDESRHLHWHQGCVDYRYRWVLHALTVEARDTWLHHFTDKDREEMLVKWVVYKLKGNHV